MARANWFQEHPERLMHQSGTTEIWCNDIFEPLGPASFILAQRIQGKFVGTVQNGRGKIFFLFWHLKGTFTCDNISEVFIRMYGNHQLKGSVAYLPFLILVWLQFPKEGVTSLVALWMCSACLPVVFFM